MARVMICDDDRVMADQLVAALRAARHEASTCNHTMDVLREADKGSFDLIAFGLDMPGFGGSRAIEVVHEIEPYVSLIGFHRRPSEIMSTSANARLAAVLPRPVSVTTFMYAVGRALEAQQMRESTLAHGNR
ncbi:MAG TPA: response regulator [Pyrinomonadaceae bacterium]|jgi:DNA-binding NtrC family response regulator|nr:response regulator [Pyrinomonadaceae bacterium]